VWWGRDAADRGGVLSGERNAAGSAMETRLPPPPPHSPSSPKLPLSPGRLSRGEAQSVFSLSSFESRAGRDWAASAGASRAGSGAKGLTAVVVHLEDAPAAAAAAAAGSVMRRRGRRRAHDGAQSSFSCLNIGRYRAAGRFRAVSCNITLNTYMPSYEQT
jgi:hypothetical protein